MRITNLRNLIFILGLIFIFLGTPTVVAADEFRWDSEIHKGIVLIWQIIETSNETALPKIAGETPKLNDFWELKITGNPPISVDNYTFDPHSALAFVGLYLNNITVNMLSMEGHMILIIRMMILPTFYWEDNNGSATSSFISDRIFDYVENKSGHGLISYIFDDLLFVHFTITDLGRFEFWINDNTGIMKNCSILTENANLTAKYIGRLTEGTFGDSKNGSFPELFIIVLAILIAGYWKKSTNKTRK